jgi:uncharacterized cupin superfamily protein
MDISAIRNIATEGGCPHVPPLTDYDACSIGWSEIEYRHFEAASPHVVVGFWSGRPGEITFDSWPYTEICSILSGKVAIRDQKGNRVEFAVGQTFLVPKGFAGDWITIESATKFFVAIS